MQVDLQGIFDKAVGGVLSQGGIAFKPEIGTCSYFTTSNEGVESKCAVGHLLPDSVVRNDPLHYGVSSMACLNPTLWASFTTDYGVTAEDESEFVTFLAEIQHQHDRAVAVVLGQNDEITNEMIEPFKIHFRERMKEIAEENNLEWNHE